jgi:transcription-repair coupling factor (superfamily II helicase)
LQAKVYEYLKTDPQIDILVTKNEKESSIIASVASFVGYDVYQLPDFRANKGDDLRSYKEELFDLLYKLNRYHFNPKKRRLIVSPINTLRHNFPKKELFKKEIIEFGMQINLNEFKSNLLNWGYSFVDIVEEEGEVSFRGDIIDIYPKGAENPFRISLFDDEVESIREFECESQKSIKEEIESFEIIAAFFGFDNEQQELVSQRDEILKSDSFIKDIHSLGFWCLEDMAENYLDALTSRSVSSLVDQINEIYSFDNDQKNKNRFLNIVNIEDAKEYKDIELSDINTFLEYHKNKSIKIIAKNEAIVKQSQLPLDLKIKYIYEDHIVNIMSDKEIIISLNKPVKRRRKKRATIVMDEMKSGDYVVHEDYGIGIFKGLTNMTVMGASKDFVEISYQNDDKLFIPVENLNVIDRYISDGGQLAIVDKLGKGSFTRLKAKTKEKLFEIAKEIIAIAAARELTNAPVINSDFDELKLLQNDSGFIYTEDQDRSIKEIFEDLKSGKVMDRLLSGDVGFG